MGEPAPPTGKPVRIRVADNAVNQRVTARMLQSLGVAVDAVENGREAIRKSEFERYHLILMACQMPEVEGYEATTAIRRRESSTADRVPIMATTAVAMEGTRERCLAAGMDDYLTKPPRFDDLKNAVQKWSAVARLISRFGKLIVFVIP